MLFSFFFFLLFLLLRVADLKFFGSWDLACVHYKTNFVLPPWSNDRLRVLFSLLFMLLFLLLLLRVVDLKFLEAGILHVFITRLILFCLHGQTTDLG